MLNLKQQVLKKCNVNIATESVNELMQMLQQSHVGNAHIVCVKAKNWNCENNSIL